MVPAGSAHLRIEAESSPVNFWYAAAIVLLLRLLRRCLCACVCAPWVWGFREVSYLLGQ